MCLLDSVASWTADRIVCHARSHLDGKNPLRRDGRLAAICGVEYALQAAALHGALIAGGVAQPAGYVAALRGVSLDVAWLDDPGLGVLEIVATMEQGSDAGMIYSFSLIAEDGRRLATGRGTVVLPRTGK